MQSLPPALAPLARYAQFILYRLTPDTKRPGKTIKTPVAYATGYTGSAFDPKNWMTSDQAIAEAKRYGEGYGVGFAFTANLGLVFVDIDNCLQPDGQWSPLAHQLIRTLPGAAVEVSQSGRGLHIIGRGIPPDHGCKNDALGLELYHTDRFVALTGNYATGSVDTDISQALPWLVNTYFTPSAASGSGPVEWSTEPVPAWRGPTDDDDLIKRAVGSKSAAAAFGTRATFAELWFADVDALAIAFPDATTPYNASQADAALAQHLAFWTGKNCERMLRIMRQSALQRDKWDREDYLPRTISAAVAFGGDVMQDKLPQPLTVEYDTEVAIQAAPTLVEGATFLTVPQQVELFKGCVYILDEHAVLTPGGRRLNSERFRVQYGGYTFMMDNSNQRTVRNAWEAFTESQGFRGPRAHTSCFKPLEAPGAILRNGHQTAVNLYAPEPTVQREGDVSRFLTHLAKVLPDPRDQTILLSYMAACVQYKGVKFRWAPLLQGLPGNGKTLLSECVAFAIGDRYTHLPKPSQLTSQFNDWQYCRLFASVDDIYIPKGDVDMLEDIKPMITAVKIEIEPKGGTKITRDVCCNLMLNANNKAALTKHRTDRRLAIFYTPQQDDGDLKRDGMDGDYFTSLTHWLRHEGGFEAVNYLLHTYAIPDEFNPATQCHRAPDTSSTVEAIQIGRSAAEQEIQEAIDAGEIGFKGGWISSLWLDKLLERHRLTRATPRGQRPELLRSMGYIRHPGLPDGRVNNVVMVDGGKPRLYVLRTHGAATLTNAADIAKAYSTAQSDSY